MRLIRQWGPGSRGHRPRATPASDDDEVRAVRGTIDSGADPGPGSDGSGRRLRGWSPLTRPWACPEVERSSVSRAEVRCARQASSTDRGVAAQKRVDVGQVLADGDFVALALVLFVPLVVVVKDQRDDVVEAVDEAVGRGRIDQPVEAAVEVGEVMVAILDLVSSRTCSSRSDASSPQMAVSSRACGQRAAPSAARTSREFRTVPARSSW